MKEHSCAASYLTAGKSCIVPHESSCRCTWGKHVIHQLQQSNPFLRKPLGCSPGLLACLSVPTFSNPNLVRHSIMTLEPKRVL